MAEPRSPARWVGLGLFVLVLLVGFVSFDRARRGTFDFHHFYLDARYVWDHGVLNPVVDERVADGARRLPFYLPFVPAALAPVAGLGREPAALVWAAMQVAALAYGLSVLRRWLTTGDQHGTHVAFAVALLVAVPAISEAAKFNQLSFVVLALVLAGGALLERGRWRTAGLAFGAAAALKLLPAVFLPWLLLKRRWSAAAGMVVGGVLVAVLPCLVAFGPRLTLEYHRQWWQYNVRGDSAGFLLNRDLPEHFVDHRNQSIGQVLARLAWDQHPYAAAWQPLRLTARSCALVGYGITAALLLGLWWLTHRPWDDLSPIRRRAELAVYATAMLVLSPLLRQYYLVWVLPAVMILARAAIPEERRTARLGGLGLLVWIVGMLAWLSPTARQYGAHLIMLLVLGGIVLAVTRTGTRSPRSAQHEAAVRSSS